MAEKTQVVVNLSSFLDARLIYPSRKAIREGRVFELLAESYPLNVSCKVTLPEADRQPAKSSSVQCFRDRWGSLSFIASISPFT